MLVGGAQLKNLANVLKIKVKNKTKKPINLDSAYRCSNKTDLHITDIT